MRRYWLLKSEPSAYSWADLTRAGRGRWDGVRNHAAAANLRAMRVGDLAAFYHSDEGKEAVGVMRVIRAAYPDPTAKGGPWVAVDVAPVRELKRPVSLVEMKRDRVLRGMKTVRQGRLSVSPVSAAEWKRLMALASIAALSLPRR